MPPNVPKGCFTPLDTGVRAPRTASRRPLGNLREIPAFEFLLNRFDHYTSDASTYPSPISNLKVPQGGGTQHRLHVAWRFSPWCRRLAQARVRTDVQHVRETPRALAGLVATVPHVVRNRVFVRVS